MKYLLLIVLIAIACGKKNNTSTKKVEELPEIKIDIIIEKDKPKDVTEQLLPHKKPIALVYHVNINTVFHCSSVNYSDCGLTAECGKDKLVCIKNTKVEYLKNRSY